jgi:hypothetical protein
MISPLAIDKETVKEFKIPVECELHPRQKIAYLEEQVNQLKMMQWRSRVDIVHAMRLVDDNNETLKNKGLQNLITHKNEVNQYSSGIVMVQKLIDELKNENPNLGEITAADNPEDY